MQKNQKTWKNRGNVEKEKRERKIRDSRNLLRYENGRVKNREKFEKRAKLRQIREKLSKLRIKM